MDGYKHHIFVSYKRERGWNRWIKDKFLERLLSYFSLKVGHPEYFHDEKDIPPGEFFDTRIKPAVRRSQVLIAFMTAEYFESPECRREMAIMMERDRLTKTGNSQNRACMIPVRLGDGHRFPKIFQTDIKPIDWGEFANLDIPADSDLSQRFGDAIKKLLDDIHPCFVSPASWSSDWESLNGDTIISQFEPLPSTLTTYRHD